MSVFSNNVLAVFMFKVSSSILSKTHQQCSIAFNTTCKVCMCLAVIAYPQFKIRSCRFHNTRRNFSLHKNLDTSWNADLIAANNAALHNSCFIEVVICLR
jgi:hypothetical protein